MQNPELIRKIRLLKAQKEYTLYDLSRILDIQVATIERWFRTGRINKTLMPGWSRKNLSL